MPVVEFACPVCRSHLVAEGKGLLCEGCSRRFEHVDGLPLLLDPELSTQQEFQRAYFDAEFAGYEQYRLDSWRLSFIERIFNSLGVLAGNEPYLDVGIGGSGATVIEAARRGVPAAGCDLSVEGVRAAAAAAADEGVHESAAFCICAAERLPFPDGCFRSASAVAVLEHLDDDTAAASELARVVAPGGLVWITVPHAYRFIPPPLWPIYFWHDRRIGHKRHYDEARLTRLFADAGMTHVTTSYTGHPVKLLQFAAASAVPSLREPRSDWWWRLEGLDRRAESRPRGAVQLSAVFRRA